MRGEREVWSQQEDALLRELREQRMIAKWSHISRILEEQFHIRGRNGKQCRLRYETHLCATPPPEEWPAEQEERLAALHNLKGNRWVEIARELNRSDNAVKNHYHSRLRRALRKINTVIALHLRPRSRPLKPTLLSRLVQAAELRYSATPHTHSHQAEAAFKLKNHILDHADMQEEQLTAQQVESVRLLLEEIAEFHKLNYKPPKNIPPRQPSLKYKGKEIISLLGEHPSPSSHPHHSPPAPLPTSHSLPHPQDDDSSSLSELQHQPMDDVQLQPGGLQGVGMGFEGMSWANMYGGFVLVSQGMLGFPYLMQREPVSLFSGKQSSFSCYNPNKQGAGNCLARTDSDYDSKASL